jgi:hypothetical protein
MVVAHDSSTIMTYIIPARPMFESILENCGLLLGFSIDDIFPVSRAGNDEHIAIKTGDDKTALDKKETAPIKGLPFSAFPNTGGLDISQAFSSILRTCTERTADGQNYIRTKELLQWFRAESGYGTSNVDLLLDFAYPKDRNFLPVQPSQITRDETSCLLVFSILLELGHGKMIDQFLRLGFIDRSMPFEITRLQTAMIQLHLPDLNTLAMAFFRRQWAYCPMVFALGMTQELPSHTVVPIVRMEPINAKGGTATLWQIDVPEDVVHQSLREIAENAKYPDARHGFVSYSNSLLKLRHVDNLRGMLISSSAISSH